MLTTITIRKDEARNIIELFGKKTLRIPLDDQDYIKEYFGVGYRQFISTIALLCTQSEEELRQTKKMAVLLEGNTPNVALSIIFTD
jgi:hypothetical protein